MINGGQVANINTRWWKRRRMAVLRRDHHLCRPCYKRGHIIPATEVDHIKRRADGGSHAMSNLQAICPACHKAKSASEDGKTYAPTIGHDGWPVGGGGV